MGEDRIFHVVHAGGKLPEGILVLSGEAPGELFMLADTRHHPDNKKITADPVLLGFATTIKENTYLSLAVVRKSTFRELKEKGWKPDVINSYAFCKCIFDKDVLQIRLMDLVTVTNAVRHGKLKGTESKSIETDEPDLNAVPAAIGDALDDPVRIRLTESSENLRRFVASNDASLFKEDKDHALTLVLKRLK